MARACIPTRLAALLTLCIAQPVCFGLQHRCNLGHGGSFSAYLVAFATSKSARFGHDTRRLQAYLGHKNIQHTVRYTELAPESYILGMIRPPLPGF